MLGSNLSRREHCQYEGASYREDLRDASPGKCHVWLNTRDRRYQSPRLPDKSDDALANFANSEWLLPQRYNELVQLLIMIQLTDELIHSNCGLECISIWIKVMFVGLHHFWLLSP